MNEVVTYLFSNLRDYEKFMSRVNRTLKRQARMNRLVIAAALGMAAYARFQNCRIDRLTAQIEELKHPEPEGE